MAHQHMPKIFYDPHKNPPAPPPTYLMYDPLIKQRLQKCYAIFKVHKDDIEFRTQNRPEY